MVDTSVPLQRVSRCLDEAVAAGDAAFGFSPETRNVSLVRELLDGCHLMWHLHAPKSGGTSIRQELIMAKVHRPIMSGFRVEHFNFASRGAHLEKHYQHINGSINSFASAGWPRFSLASTPRR